MKRNRWHSRLSRRDTQSLRAVLYDVLAQLETIMSALDDLKAQVAATVTVEQSAVTLIQGIAAQLEAALANSASPDPAIADLTAQLKTGADALAAAVAANPDPVPPDSTSTDTSGTAPAASTSTDTSSTDTGTSGTDASSSGSPSSSSPTP